MSFVAYKKRYPVRRCSLVEDYVNSCIAAVVHYDFYNPLVHKAVTLLLRRITDWSIDKSDDPSFHPDIENALIKARKDLFKMQAELDDVMEEDEPRDNEISLQYSAVHIDREHQLLTGYVLGADAPAIMIVPRKGPRRFLLDCDDRGYRRLPDCGNAKPMTYSVPFLPGDLALITSVQKDAAEWDQVEEIMRRRLISPRFCYMYFIYKKVFDDKDDLIVLSLDKYFPNDLPLQNVSPTSPDSILGNEPAAAHNSG